MCPHAQTMALTSRQRQLHNGEQECTEPQEGHQQNATPWGFTLEEHGNIVVGNGVTLDYWESCFHGNT